MLERLFLPTVQDSKISPEKIHWQEALSQWYQINGRIQGMRELLRDCEENGFEEAAEGFKGALSLFYALLKTPSACGGDEGKAEIELARQGYPAALRQGSSLEIERTAGGGFILNLENFLFVYQQSACSPKTILCDH